MQAVRDVALLLDREPASGLAEVAPSAGWLLALVVAAIVAIVLVMMTPSKDPGRCDQGSGRPAGLVASARARQRHGRTAARREDADDAG
jgi:hypothetical protein